VKEKPDQSNRAGRRDRQENGRLEERKETSRKKKKWGRDKELIETCRGNEIIRKQTKKKGLCNHHITGGE